MTPAAVGALAALGVLLAASRGSSRTRREQRPRTPAQTRAETTEAYARSKLAMLRARAREPWARTAERWARVHLPGVPPEAVVALTASSMGPREKVPGRDRHQGLFGTEAARIESIGRDETTRRELRRVVTLQGFAEDTHAQAYLGVRRYALALREVVAACVARGVDPEVNVDSWSPWEYQLAVAGYSAGQGATAAVVAANPVAVQRAPRVGVRWTRLAEDSAPAILRGDPVGGLRARGPGGAAWVLVRPRERYVCALLLARAEGSREGWYEDLPSWPSDVDAALVAASARR